MIVFIFSLGYARGSIMTPFHPSFSVIGLAIIITVGGGISSGIVRLKKREYDLDYYSTSILRQSIKDLEEYLAIADDYRDRLFLVLGEIDSKAKEKLELLWDIHAVRRLHLPSSACEENEEANKDDDCTNLTGCDDFRRRMNSVKE